MDRDPKQLREVLTRADAHRGASLVEVYQNCNVFNDGAFGSLHRQGLQALPHHLRGARKPLVFANGTKGIRLDCMRPMVVDLEGGEWARTTVGCTTSATLQGLHPRAPVRGPDRGGRHAAALRRVFYQADRPTHEEKLNAQGCSAREEAGRRRPRRAAARPARVDASVDTGPPASSRWYALGHRLQAPGIKPVVGLAGPRPIGLPVVRPGQACMNSDGHVLEDPFLDPDLEVLRTRRNLPTGTSRKALLRHMAPGGQPAQRKCWPGSRATGRTGNVNMVTYRCQPWGPW